MAVIKNRLLYASILNVLIVLKLQDEVRFSAASREYSVHHICFVCFIQILFSTSYRRSVSMIHTTIALNDDSDDYWSLSADRQLRISMCAIGLQYAMRISILICWNEQFLWLECKTTFIRVLTYLFRRLQRRQQPLCTRRDLDPPAQSPDDHRGCLHRTRTRLTRGKNVEVTDAWPMHVADACTWCNTSRVGR